MKTKLLILFFAFLSNIIFGQSAEHLTFKGVPIDGKIDDYTAKMKQNGFDHLGTEDGVAMLKGDFAGYKDCIVGVSTLKDKDLVNKIGVLFPETEAWSVLSENYFKLKELLTEKYGRPSDYKETFETYSQPKDDGSKMLDVKLDHCKYYSIWQTDKGEIQLSIEHQSRGGGYVKLGYFDKINGSIIRDKAKDDL